MRHGEIKTVKGAWSEQDNAWVSEVLCLTGDCWLEVTLPDKGRLVIKKSESANGPFPKALITEWDGPQFKIRIYGTTISRYIKVCLTDTPTNIQIASI
jgi:hypothetical protein